MFVRRTDTRATANGQRYCTHRLVRSERRGARVRRRTLLNLSRHFSVPQADWPLRCGRIEQLLSPQDALLSTCAENVVPPDEIRSRNLFTRSRISISLLNLG